MAIQNDNFNLESLDFDDTNMGDDKAPLIDPSNGNTNNHTQTLFPVDANELGLRNVRPERCCDAVATVSSHLRSSCTTGNCARAALKFFPFVRIMLNYNWRQNVVSDIVAGLTIGVMTIPQGMAYAILAELDPVIGLYVSFFAPLLYFFFGTSLQMSVGTFALASLMVADPVTRLAGDHVEPELLHGLNLSQTIAMRNISRHEVMAELRWEVALSVSLLVGLLQLAMGALRLGFVAVFLSDALASGFTTGAAFHVFTSQLPAVFGLKIRRHSGMWKLIKTYRDLLAALPQTNLITLAVSGVALSVLIVVRIFINPHLMKRIKFPLPIELLLVICGTMASYFLNLHTAYAVEVIGKIPSGFPTPHVPSLRLMPNLILDAGTIAVFIFGCSVSLAKIFSRKHKYELDANQEAFALGLINTVTPFFGAYIAAGSLSRSMVQDEMGGKSQLASVISSALLLVVLLAIGPLFSAVPDCILSCIILISLKGLFKQFVELPRLWRICKYDCAIWLVTFLCTLLLDVGLGLFLGFAFSLLTVVSRAHAFTASLGAVEVNVRDEGSQGTIPSSTRILKFEGPLYFGSCERLRSSCLSLLDLPDAPTSPIRRNLILGSENGPIASSCRAPLRRVILDCSRITFVDSAGMRSLESLATELEPLGVELLIVDTEGAHLKQMSFRPGENVIMYQTMTAALQISAQHCSSVSEPSMLM